MRFSTDRELKALPKDKRAYHKDSLMKNLYVFISPTQKGVSTIFYFRYMQNKKISSIKIGKYPITSLAQARIKANALNLKLESKESLKEVPLLLIDVYNEWIKANAQKDRGLYLHIISKYESKKLKDLSKQDVLACLDKLHKENKRESIKRVFGRLCKLIKYAISREYIQASPI